MVYTITRENNKYNKSFKWHLVGLFDNGGKHSYWYKTKKEALYKKNWFEKGVAEKYRTG